MNNISIITFNEYIMYNNIIINVYDQLHLLYNYFEGVVNDHF